MRNTIFDEDKLLVKVAGTPSEKSPDLIGLRAWVTIDLKYQRYA